MKKPSIPKGTRDFSPEEMVKRNYIFDTIREVYKLYGFHQIETPSMENMETLMGKYGDEGDKLLFRILDSGDFLSDFGNAQTAEIEKTINSIEKLDRKIFFRKKHILTKLKEYTSDHDNLASFAKDLRERMINKRIIETDRTGNELISTDFTLKEIQEESKIFFAEIASAALKYNVIAPIVGRERGLRYDLTVPFARYVVMHRNEITFPFRRYQIQPVWRADRPQKGRYREFFQCDADIVGSDSLINEVELIQIIDEVFHRFGIRVSIKLNNRKILSGIAEVIGEMDKIVDITVAIDKLDKIGLEKVNDELAEKGVSPAAIEKLQPIILLSGTNREKLATLRNSLVSSTIGTEGINEIEFILDKIELSDIRCDLELDLTLARGLNYYTGAIIEVKALDVEIGSITGGGRYDNLTGIFGLEGVSGVGISFGADRIFDVLNWLDLYPKETRIGAKVLFVNFGSEEEKFILKAANKLRLANISTEVFPESAKMQRQMKYANANNVPFVAIVGENELKEQKIMLKDMISGDQSLLTLDECIEKLK